MDERLENLEIHYGYLQRTVDELNAVIREQHQEIRQLQRELLRFTQEFEDFLLSTSQVTHEKPPHY